MNIPRAPFSSALTLAFVLGALPVLSEKLQPVKHLIDTHIHLYDTTCPPNIPSWPRQPE